MPSPILPTPLGPATQRLADELTRLFEESDLTYDQLQTRTLIPKTTVFNCVQLRTRPAWSTVRAVGLECGGSGARLRDLWIEAAQELGLPLEETSVEKLGDPGRLTSPAEFMAGLRGLRVEKGNRPLRAMSAAMNVPLSTLSRRLRDDRLPEDPAFVQKFVNALGVGTVEAKALSSQWLRAWSRLKMEAADNSGEQPDQGLRAILEPERHDAVPSRPRSAPVRPWQTLIYPALPGEVVEENATALYPLDGAFDDDPSGAEVAGSTDDESPRGVADEVSAHALAAAARVARAEADATAEVEGEFSANALAAAARAARAEADAEAVISGRFSASALAASARASSAEAAAAAAARTETLIAEARAEARAEAIAEVSADAEAMAWIEAVRIRKRFRNRRWTRRVNGRGPGGEIVRVLGLAVLIGLTIGLYTAAVVHSSQPLIRLLFMIIQGNP